MAISNPAGLIRQIILEQDEISSKRATEKKGDNTNADSAYHLILHKTRAEMEACRKSDSGVGGPENFSDIRRTQNPLHRRLHSEK